MDRNAERLLLIRQIVECAAASNETGYREVSARYANVFPPTTNRAKRFAEYDLCRQSCAGAFSDPSMRDVCIKDAKERLARIERGK